MAFLVQVHKRNSFGETRDSHPSIPDIIGYSNHYNNNRLESVFEYEEDGQVYYYEVELNILICPRPNNPSIFYYQMLTPIDRQIKSPSIYLLAMTNDYGIPAKGYHPNNPEPIECILPIVPKTANDYIAVNGTCYSCKKITYSKDGIRLDFNIHSPSLNDTLGRYDVR
ncbi:MAG: hypothetical protein ABI402_17315 [Ferruginibacter sp.]